MQLNRCPVCHARISLDALVQDESGRELLGLLCRMNTDCGTALVGYLGLFRSATRDLANDKALRLAREVLALGAVGLVALAMQKTVENLQGHGNRSLTNHNYLKKVMADTTPPSTSTTAHEVRDGMSFNVGPVNRPPQSKTAQALQALEGFGNE